MHTPLGLVVGKTYKFTLGWASSQSFQSEIIGKVINVRTQPYSEVFCVVNDQGLIYLWNVPKTRTDMSRIIHKVEEI